MSQKYRIAMGNRALQTNNPTIDKWANVFEDNEHELDREIMQIAIGFPIVEKMMRVKGMGLLFAAQLFCEVSIEECDTVSKLWRFAGLGLYDYWQNSDGKIVSPRSGYKWVNGEKVYTIVEPEPSWSLVKVRDRKMYEWTVPYNITLRSLMYNIGTSFLRANSPYRTVYDTAKVEYLNREWSNGHASMAAMRKMNKLFLAHLWSIWRESEGLPITQKNKFDSKKDKSFFGWEEPKNSRKRLTIVKRK